MRYGKMVFGTVAAILAVYAVACWVGAGRMVMPPRKPLLENHRMMLSGMDAAAVSVHHATAPSGTPFLLCEPIRESLLAPAAKSCATSSQHRE